MISGKNPHRGPIPPRPTGEPRILVWRINDTISCHSAHFIWCKFPNFGLKISLCGNFATISFWQLCHVLFSFQPVPTNQTPAPLTIQASSVLWLFLPFYLQTDILSLALFPFLDCTMSHFTNNQADSQEPPNQGTPQPTVNNPLPSNLRSPDYMSDAEVTKLVSAIRYLFDVGMQDTVIVPTVGFAGAAYF